MSASLLVLFVLVLQPRGMDSIPDLQNGPYTGSLPSRYERTVVQEAVLYELGPGMGKAVVVLAAGEPVEIYRVVGFVDKRPHFDRITNVVFRLGEEPDPESTGVLVGDLDGDGVTDLTFTSTQGERRFLFREVRYQRSDP